MTRLDWRSFVCALGLSLSLAACGVDEAPAESETEASATAEPTPEPDPEPAAPAPSDEFPMAEDFESEVAAEITADNLEEQLTALEEELKD